jgi:CubicO group peptidase (beta-lactamase class C family)
VTPEVGARDALFERLEQAVATEEAPGCVALVWRRGGVVYHEAHGFLATHASSPVRGVPVARDTIYDLASLTKVLCTTTLAARLIQRGKLDLQDPIPPELRPVGDRGVPTLANLLEHGAGLEAHREYFSSADSRESLIAAVRETSPLHPPGEAVLYSDLGFILLGAWLEQLGGAPLDRLFERWVTRPLGLDIDRALDFRPVSASGLDGGELQRVAPTEVYDPALHEKAATPPSWLSIRERVHAHGEVHDDNAYRMGGVAGHAGLFGHAEAVLQLARVWVESSPLSLDGELGRRFRASSSIPGSTRRLGWDAPDPAGTGSTGRSLSGAAFGHLGFTGTSVWIDPDPVSKRSPSIDGASIYILLSNRVHPTRNDDRIRELRRDFHRLATQL